MKGINGIFKITIECEPKKLDEKFIPNTIARKTDIVQIDWNQNDENAKDYIKNKTHFISTSNFEYNGDLKDGYWDSVDDASYDYSEIFNANATILGIITDETRLAPIPFILSPGESIKYQRVGYADVIITLYDNQEDCVLNIKDEFEFIEESDL